MGDLLDAANAQGDAHEVSVSHGGLAEFLASFGDTVPDDVDEVIGALDEAQAAAKSSGAKQYVVICVTP